MIYHDSICSLHCIKSADREERRGVRSGVYMLDWHVSGSYPWLTVVCSHNQCNLRSCEWAAHIAVL